VQVSSSTCISRDLFVLSCAGATGYQAYVWMEMFACCFCSLGNYSAGVGRDRYGVLCCARGGVCHIVFGGVAGG